MGTSEIPISIEYLKIIFEHLWPKYFTISLNDVIPR